MNYREKLLDPRWQKKKSEIMTRDNFTCQQCGAKYKTLHVHHLAYKRCHGDPWGCPDSDLITLCEDCHQSLHYQKIIEEDIAKAERELAALKYRFEIVKRRLEGTEIGWQYVIKEVNYIYLEEGDWIFDIFMTTTEEPFLKIQATIIVWEEIIKKGAPKIVQFLKEQISLIYCKYGNQSNIQI